MNKKNEEQKAATSGPTQSVPKEGKATVKVPVSAVQAGGGLNSFYARTSVDSSPGWNTVTIFLPAGTSVASVWMTEWAVGNKSHAGGAFFTTASVQLYANGTRCRVRFFNSWHTHLATGCQIIYG